MPDSLLLDRCNADNLGRCCISIGIVPDNLLFDSASAVRLELHGSLICGILPAIPLPEIYTCVRLDRLNRHSGILPSNDLEM